MQFDLDVQLYVHLCVAIVQRHSKSRLSCQSVDKEEDGSEREAGQFNRWPLTRLTTTLTIPENWEVWEFLTSESIKQSSASLTPLKPTKPSSAIIYVCVSWKEWLQARSYSWQWKKGSLIGFDSFSFYISFIVKGQQEGKAELTQQTSLINCDFLLISNFCNFPYFKVESLLKWLTS